MIADGVGGGIKGFFAEDGACPRAPGQKGQRLPREYGREQFCLRGHPR